jgi:hypothetical protein
MEFSASGSREFEFDLLEFPTFGSVKPLLYVMSNLYVGTALF